MLAPKIEPIRGEQPLFATMGEQLRAIMNVEIDRRVDPRLTDVHRRAATIGGSEQVPSDGGFLLQPEFSRQIVKRMYETGQILKRCTVLPTNTGGVAYPQIDEGSRIGGSRLGGVQGHWVDEGDPLNPPKLGTSLSEVPRFNLSTVVPHKVAVFMYVSDELARDSNAFEAWATYAGSQELTYKIEGAIISGTGAGMPQGILNSPALVTTPAATGQASKTVVSQNINAMLSSFWTPSYNSPGSIWLYNQALLPQMSTLATVVGSAGSESKLWAWATSGDDYDTLAGIPACQSEYCPVPGTPGDIILADLSRYMLVVRELIRSEVSIHVKFISDTSTFRFVARIGGQTIDRSSVLPANGNIATSSFVALAARP